MEAEQRSHVLGTVRYLCLEAGEEGREAPRLEAFVYRLNEASERLGRAIDNLTLLLRLPI